MRGRSSFGSLGWLVSAALLLPGCSDGRPPLYSAGGTVTFADGTPVRSGAVEFMPNDGGPSPRAKIDQSGGFDLGTYQGADGAPAGEYRVVVIQTTLPSASAVADKLGAAHQLHADSLKEVSLKHASPDTTDLDVRVSAGGENRFDLTVEAK